MSIEWKEPVRDRTHIDIDLQRAKGKLGYEDLNRIEKNMEYIHDWLGFNYEPKDWSKRPIPTPADFERILSALQLIKNNITTVLLPDVPQMPINHYEKVNLIEEIQYRANNYLFNAETPFIICGEGYAGETIGVI